MAEKARYSNASYVYEDEDGVRHMILGRCFVGVSHDFGTAIDRSLREPPETSEGSTRLAACSVKGGPHQPSQSGPGGNDSVMYVFYDHYQVYPEYIVSYRTGGQG